MTKSRKMGKKQLKQSETTEIRRSMINLNPYNPKRHSEEKVAEQRKNLQRVGYLGGITWNRRTGNLIDGHRRIKALDLYYKYDGTTGTDYMVKVEAVDFDEKQEKEQMTYMALGNTKADYQLIAEYLSDIDYSAAGIDSYDLSQIQNYLPTLEDFSIDTYDDLIEEPEKNEVENSEEKKSKIKENKRKQMEDAGERYENLTAYLTISFANSEEKRIFCELAGINENEKFIKGCDILNMIE